MAEYMPGSFDCLITDVSMPDMSGRQIADIVRQIIPSVKILVMSGHEDAERFGDSFIAKPFKPSKLLDLIHDLIDTRTSKAKNI